jgi:uncharacterized protein (DUF1501 family)
MPNRREFIRGCCAAASMGMFAGFSRFGVLNALAQGGGYRALVCVFLFGGNDGNNLLVPMSNDPSVAQGFRYSDYFSIRADQAQGGLGLTQAQLAATQVLIRTAQPSGARDFAFHPALPQTRALFQSNKVAIVANMGVLNEPLTRTEYLNRTKPRPANLFSHSDQQQQWQTSDPTGFGTTGWAGRTADRIRNIYDVGALYPPITTVAGTAIFCTGSQTYPFALTPTTNPSTIGLQGYNGSAQANARLQALQELLTFDTGISLIQHTSSITDRALRQSAMLAGALQGITLQTAFPTTSIGNQLAQVARIIKANQQTLGLQRQVFFTSMGGYDTHTTQIPDQDNLLAQLDPALNAFYNATLELGVSSSVTTFILSEFGRTLKPAAGAGSDHGWGSHMLVVGDSVLGGDMYGRFPEFRLSGPDDASSNGRWIPTTSVDQFGATLARWFGVPDADLPSVFPNLPNFPTGNLGFMA